MFQEGSELILDVGCGSGDVTCEILAPVVEECIEAREEEEGDNRADNSRGGGRKSSVGSNGSSGSNKHQRRRRSQIIGVDISNEMVQHARER